MKVTEATIQAVLMRHFLVNRSIELVLPNSNDMFRWEADLLCVTRAGLIHEVEIKTTKQDYKKDKEKPKHLSMGLGRSPSYFWYATYQFEIVPPEKYGWIFIDHRPDGSFRVTEKTPAPRLGNWNIDEFGRAQIGRSLSWHVMRAYMRLFAKVSEIEIEQSRNDV